jgi:hypothetical protein
MLPKLKKKIVLKTRLHLILFVYVNIFNSKYKKLHFLKGFSLMKMIKSNEGTIFAQNMIIER